MTAYRRLVEELLDPHFYEKTVHPKRNYSEPTRVNLSMSLYQILDVVCVLTGNEITGMKFYGLILSHFLKFIIKESILLAFIHMRKIHYY